MVHVGQLINKQGLINYSINWIIKYQTSGYLSSFYVRKVTQTKLNVLNVVSGAFGAFRRDVLQHIGGYRDTLGEDMEITFRLQKYMHNRNLGEKMIFIPEAVCYTEVPENFASSCISVFAGKKDSSIALIYIKKTFSLTWVRSFLVFSYLNPSRLV